MIRTVLSVALTLALAIGGGSASVWYMLDRTEGVGAVRIGPWTAYPAAGTSEADPYSKARTALSGSLALGKAEGLAFTAKRDTAGAPLSRRCSYRVEGDVPPAKVWTLFARGSGGADRASSGLKAAALHSGEIVTTAGGNPVVVVSRHPSPGNWIAPADSGELALTLTLYDTPISGSIDLAKAVLPRILRLACDG